MANKTVQLKKKKGSAIDRLFVQNDTDHVIGKLDGANATLTTILNTIFSDIATLENQDTYHCVYPATSVSGFPTTGNTKVLYVDTTAQKAYIWNSSTSKYVSLGGGGQEIVVSSTKPSKACIWYEVL